MSTSLVIHDISLTVREGMVHYPKDLPYRRRTPRNLEKGDTSTTSEIEMSAHTGTHLDAPVHFIPGGIGVDRLGLDVLYGPAAVADCRGTAAVTAELLTGKIPAGTERLLLKTDNSQRLLNNPDKPFQNDYVFVDGSAARLLVERGVKLVGIDYLTIDAWGSQDKPAHHILLGSGAVIVEGVNLADVEPGIYFLACGSMKLADADGAPCRAVLIENFS
jgi:arylformamidase